MEAEGVPGKAGGSTQTLGIPKAPKRGWGAAAGGGLRILTWDIFPLPHRWGPQPLHLQGQPLLGGVS